MERLTERLENGVINVKYASQHETAIHRLAAIEDILGDEYDLDRLRELVEIDSAGCIPPCKIGDVFYRVCYGFDSSEIEKYRVSMVTQKSDRSWRIRATDTEESFQIDWSLDDFSKRAYKTCEEAEAALKAREQDERLHRTR